MPDAKRLCSLYVTRDAMGEDGCDFASAIKGRRIGMSNAIRHGRTPHPRPADLTGRSVLITYAVCRRVVRRPNRDWETVEPASRAPGATICSHPFHLAWVLATLRDHESVRTGGVGFRHVGYLSRTQRWPSIAHSKNAPVQCAL